MLASPLISCLWRSLAPLITTGVMKSSRFSREIGLMRISVVPVAPISLYRLKVRLFPVTRLQLLWATLSGQFVTSTTMLSKLISQCLICDILQLETMSIFSYASVLKICWCRRSFLWQTEPILLNLERWVKLLKIFGFHTGAMSISVPNGRLQTAPMRVFTSLEIARRP